MLAIESLPDKKDPKNSDICLNINFSYTFEIFDKILTGL